MLQATAMKTGYMADAVARFLCNFLPWLPRKVPQFQNQALIWIKHLRESFPGLRFQIYKLINVMADFFFQIDNFANRIFHALQTWRIRPRHIRQRSGRFGCAFT